jgi:hypothetical protein
MARKIKSSKSDIYADPVNFYETIPEKYIKDSEYRNPNEYAPQHPFRLLICGSSGSGKTNIMFNIINACDCFDKIYIFAKNIEEPLYKYAKDRLSKQVLFMSDDITKLPPLNNKDVKEQKLVIFDDFVTEDKNTQKLITEYFIRSRKNNISCAYISQSYFLVPKIIRINCNYIILKKIGSDKDFTMILADHKIGNVNTKQLKQMYQTAIKDGLTGFFMIDLATPSEDMKFRSGLYQAFKLSDLEDEE